MTTQTVTRHVVQSAEDHKVLDFYRDHTVTPVYHCPVCQFRGISWAVSVHRDHCTGTMLREEPRRD